MKRIVTLLALSMLVLAGGASLLAKGRPTVQLDETFRAGNFSAIDQALAQQGISARLWTVEYVTAPDSGEYGGTIFSRDVGNKQLSAHWVPGDPNRYGVNELYWTIDQTEFPSSPPIPLAYVNEAIDRAMETWQQSGCSTIPLVKIPDFGYDWGFVEYLLGFGGTPGWLADITHAGWLPAAFFDALRPNGSQSILGVTFTFVWNDDLNNPTDIDRNGKNDVAFREIYYNDAFIWSVDGPGWNDDAVDIESIALHETGHGLSQAHFGKMFVDASDPEPPYSIDHLHFAPRAVMNAIYFGTLRDPQKSDVGGHCSIWGSWPQH